MRAAHRQGWWVALLMASAGVLGCSRGSTGPAELFLDSVVGAIAHSGKPDLWVSSVAGPASATSGSGYFVTVTACNQGAGSVESLVKLYLSSDASITSEDSVVGSAPTGLLHSKQCATLHVQTVGPVSVPNGLWFLGARIDPEDSVSEVSETNNARAGTQMAIGSGAELTVSRVSAPASVSPSGRFETTVEVCNTGTASASADVDVYLSSGTELPSAEMKVGSGSTGALPEGQCTQLTIPATARVARGAWSVVAWVDRANTVPELVEGNNLRFGERVIVDDGPDFTVAAVSGPDSLPSGSSEPVALTLTVCNQGNVAGSTRVDAYLSADSLLTAADVLVGSAPVDSLEPGQCAPVSVRGAASVSRGLWYLAAWVDRANAVPELVEGNNTRISGRVPAGSMPDLVLSAVGGPGSVASGQQLRASATVCNQGTSPSSATSVSFFLSLDASITTADAPVGSAPVPELLAGQCAPVELTGQVQVQEGAWYLGAYVDTSNGVVELSESNNTRAGNILGVGDGADLYVSSVTGPALLPQAGAFTGQVTVCNQGTQATHASARVGLFLSSDASITAADTLIGDVRLSPLAAGECATLSVPGGARLPAGTWYLGAIANLDGGEPELLKDNNIRVGSSLAIGSTVAALHAPARFPSGPSLTATATARN